MTARDSITAQTRDFFLARQPILNRGQGLVAYELLFRRAETGNAGVIDDLAATASVIEHASALGMANVIGDALGFVNIDSTVLMSEVIQFLPYDKVVLEILETVRATDAVFARVEELKKMGYTFALDDVVAYSEDIQKLLPLVDIIKLDIAALQPATLSQLSARFKSAGKKLLAEKVETHDEYQRCLELGFDYFQGYYFARPAILSGKKLSPSQVVLVQLMGQVNSGAENTDIERTIKQDASLGLALLRMVNSPALGMGHRITSLGQALMVLGRRQLQRWLQILLYAEPNQPAGSRSPLLVMASTRGKLLELMANRIKPGNRDMADTAFTVGIMSLVDALFASPMEKILAQIPVADAVESALLSRSGIYGEMLRLAEYLETSQRQAALLGPALQAMQLAVEDLHEMQLAAYEWSAQVSLHS